jgi:hypothetical protein
MSTLGLIALTRMKEKLIPPEARCVGTPTAPVRLQVAPRTCGLIVTSESQLAGHCVEGSRGLASCSFNGAPAAALVPGYHELSVVAVAQDQSTARCTSYLEVADGEAPQLSCPAPRTVECTGAMTQVKGEASCADNCGACTASCTQGPFPVGTTDVACTARDSSGNASSCDSALNVIDSRTPALDLAASPAVLWPPDHRLHPISLVTRAVDQCDSSPRINCAATSNEPEDGAGDGRTDADIVWSGGQLSLRAERSAEGDGRVYTITCVATDASGNRAMRATSVLVPKSMGQAGR